MDLFSTMIPRIKFSINKELIMNENFSGVGTFSMGFKKAGFQVKIRAISEIDKYCIRTYNELHGEVENLGAVGEFDKLPAGVDICTWSFPCQDVSNAGQGKGMKEGTRSNYGYVFLETLKNTPEKDRPKVLIMENVALLFSKKWKDDWREIQNRLSECGYSNYPGVMNAKDYGVAQNRNRVFIVSILGNYSYEFPKEIVETIIEAGCKTKGTVLDMFLGSGTTCHVAKAMNRDCIGIEINPEYAAIAKERMQRIQISMFGWKEE